MDFSLNSEQEMLRKMFYDFAGKEVAKVADQADKQEQLSARLLQKMAAQGFFGALAPEEPYGGAGLDATSFTLLLEPLAWECMSTALAIHVHNSLALRTILRHASPELREEIVPEMVAGERIGAFALTEASAGSDPTGLRTRAVREGDGYVLNGTKTWVSNGGLAGAYVVFAATDPAAEARGMSAFVVPAETAGLEVGGREKTLGMRGVSITRIYFNNCRVPERNLLGKEGQGYRIALEALDFGRMGVSAAAVGTARRALELGTKFSTERIQFGVPIAQKQAIQAYLADAATSIAAGECLVRRTAWMVDNDVPFTQQAAMAKLFTSRMAANVTDQVVQIHGGYGFIEAYPIERYYRDARALELVEGTSQIQQIIIAGGLLADYGMKVRP
jgi:alkylation response protein AidB-like acyl-CoA dehydrogenase